MDTIRIVIQVSGVVAQERAPELQGEQSPRFRASPAQETAGSETTLPGGSIDGNHRAIRQRLVDAILCTTLSALAFAATATAADVDRAGRRVLPPAGIHDSSLDSATGPRCDAADSPVVALDGAMAMEGDEADSRDARDATDAPEAIAAAASLDDGPADGAATADGAAPRADDDIAALQKAFDLRSQAATLASQGRIDAAVAAVDEALPLVRGDTPLARQFRASLLDTRAFARLTADAGKVAADSLAAADIWRTLGPAHAESRAGSLLNAGFALTQTKRHADAAAALVEARDTLAALPNGRDGRLLQAFSLLAQVALETNDDPAATAALADYVRLAAELGRRADPAFAPHLRLLGLRLLATESPDAARLGLWSDEAVAAAITPEDAVVFQGMTAKLLQAGDYARSLRVADRLVAWRRVQEPRDDLGLAAALEQVGKAAAASGDVSAAKRALREACDLLADDHPRELAILRTELAGVAVSTGEYLQAEADYEAAIRTLAALGGSDRVAHAIALGGLGMVNLQLGDVARARLRLGEAVRAAEAIQGADGRVAGHLLVQQAIAEAVGGDFAAARRSFGRGREFIATSFGADHPVLLMFDQVGAGMELEAGGDLVAAETLLEGVVERLGGLSGGGGLIRGQALETLAEVAIRRGDRRRALSLFSEARTIRESAGDGRSLVFVRSLLRTAEVRGLDDPASRADVARALELCDTLLGPAFATLSERRQIAAAAVAHRALGVALSIGAADDPDEAAALHGRMLRWKGAIFVRQREVRRALAEPETAAVAAELRDVSERIAAAVRQPGMRLGAETLVTLTDRRDALERRLAEAAGGEPRGTVTTAAVAAALPESAALVDVLEYAPGGSVAPGDRRLVAFVVRRGRSVARVDLGPATAVTEQVAAWRPWQAAAPAGAAAAAAALRRMLWQPLEPYLAGAEVVLVSPDGCVSEIPFAALPGTAAGEVLLDDVLVAHVPVPSLLPRMLARPRSATGGGRMLLVGDVDFGVLPDGGGPGPAIAPGGFPALPGTGREIESIAALAGDVDPPVVARRLERGAATVDAVRGGMPDARLIHIATHGFFAAVPPAAAGGLTRGIAAAQPLAADASTGDDAAGVLHPGVLSGIVLAGANSGRGMSAGILTALELADTDLGNADLVVLSACDTRRGRQAAGEGLLGLQRAFEVAGAGSVVATLWQVDDDATAALMQEFYRNLWHRRMPRGEALRRAQRHVAREYTLDGGIVRSRGVAAAVPLAADAPLPPAFWAGFVLSGDWR